MKTIKISIVCKNENSIVSLKRQYILNLHQKKNALENILPKGLWYQPDDIKKTKAFYEYIIQYTHYAEITHKPDFLNVLYRVQHP